MPSLDAPDRRPRSFSPKREGGSGASAAIPRSLAARGRARGRFHPDGSRVDHHLLTDPRMRNRLAPVLGDDKSALGPLPTTGSSIPACCIAIVREADLLVAIRVRTAMASESYGLDGDGERRRHQGPGRFDRVRERRPLGGRIRRPSTRSSATPRAGSSTEPQAMPTRSGGRCTAAAGPPSRGGCGRRRRGAPGVGRRGT